MVRIVMALLAKERLPGLQQGNVVRTVRIVAIEAVVACHRVLPQERTALLGVAAVASLVHRIFQ